MSDVRIIATLPTSSNILLDLTKHEEVYIGNEYRRNVYNDTWDQVRDRYWKM